MTISTPEHRAPQLIDAVRTEQVRLLYADGSGYITTLFIGAVLEGILLWQRTLSISAAVVWLGALTVYTIARVALRAAYRRADPPVTDWRRWAYGLVAATIASGLIWAAGMPFFLAEGRFDLQTMTIATLVAGTYGMVGSTGAYLPAFSAFFLPFTTVIVWLAAQGDPLHIASAGILLVWLPSVALLARRYNRSLVEALRLRFENAALADDLRAQKQMAEQSNLAKSRFLAAASHDLRQPVHALGMFIGALRSHRLGARSREIVDHMDGSIGALDNLFGSLLDISRLDAGVIEAKPACVELQPLLARICRDLTHEAEAKGVALRLVATSANVVSDPVLLERILRNLIGNAVRHTEAGRVLVGVRRGDQTVRLEILDTGPGIAPELQETVFEEFYQIGNPDRDRRRGLGLGLPIVRRLCRLLGHALTMRSVPGHGTYFGVEALYLAPTAAQPGSEPDATVAALRTGFIVLIDDEQAIRIAMMALFESWGHRVIAAAGPAEAIAALVSGRTPDLIICDYRLRDGLDGIEAIQQIETALEAVIPAILVTGDTAPERIRLAAASGYPLLHKPLSHVRLRAAITSLLRRGAMTQTSVLPPEPRPEFGSTRRTP